MKHFIHRAGQDYGPYTLEDLRKFVAEGFFKVSDQARAEDMTNWVTIAALLQETSTTASATLPLPQLAVAHAESTAVMAAPVTLAAPATTVPLPLSRPGPKRSALSPLTWPFYEPSWMAGMWIPLLWWIFIPLIPAPPLALLALVGGMLLNIGWFLDAVRRRGHRDPNLLPHCTSFLVMLKDGFVFLLMCTFYFTIPLLLIGVLFQWSWNSLVLDAASWAGHWVYYWIFASARDSSPETLSAFVAGQEQSMVLSWLAPVVYLFISIPLFVVATVRFAVTRKFLSYFKVIRNLLLLLRHFPSFLFLSLLAMVWYGLLCGGALVINQVGFFLQPFLGAVTAMLLLPATLWVAAYLAGNFGRHLCESKAAAREVHY